MSTSSLLPNLIIGGVFKAATTSLFTYLTMHPDVCGSAKKETRFFTMLAKNENPPPMEEYLRYFSACQHTRYRLEASPDYFYGGRDVAEIMRDKLPEDTRIIFMFRDPIERFVSHFRHEKKFLYLPQDINIDTYVQQWHEAPIYDDIFFPLEASFYNRYLNDWFDVFGDNVKVLFFEQINHDRDKLLAELSAWLDIDPTLFNFDDMIVENKTVGFKNSTLQRIALTINRQGEIFWRRNPKLKRQLKQLYLSLNGAKSTDTLSEAENEKLQQVFVEPNNDLLQLLKSKGYQEFPSWLAAD